MKHSVHRRIASRSGLLSFAVAVVCALLPAIPVGAVSGDTLVSNGSPATPFPQNKQNEPALAVDANHPNVLVAGANDELDLGPCFGNKCPFTPGVGTSGVYFSFDSGANWSQPTYTGLSGRSCLATGPCTATIGPIGTLPKYNTNGLTSDGDPALAFGPRPLNGAFSWSNGSRLYYANLTSNIGSKPDETFRGFEAVAVSRTDDVASAAANNADAWSNPVIVSKQSSTTFSDKEQIWADNAASSPFFGNVYLCWGSFRSDSHGNASPQPLIVATSTDGGDTWTQAQVTAASNNPFNVNQGFGRSGCSVRTDSRGVAYVFAQQFAVGTPATAPQILVKSFDGGKSWTKPVDIGQVTNTCFLLQFDGTGTRCVMDGVGGARDDLSASPSVDIANGAPSGIGATNEILRSWADGRDGVNREHVFVSFSTDGGANWSSPNAVESVGDRGYYSAVAISPKGKDAYLVYNAFTTPLDTVGNKPHMLVGVVKHADVSGGAPGAFAEIHRGVPGDARGSSQNNLWLSFLGDYVYAIATDTYGAAVWNDVRNAADCPAIDNWRIAAQQAIQNGTAVPTKPAPGQACPPNFGNSDIFGGSFIDPTP